MDNKVDGQRTNFAFFPDIIYPKAASTERYAATFDTNNDYVTGSWLPQMTYLKYNGDNGLIEETQGQGWKKETITYNDDHLPISTTFTDDTDPNNPITYTNSQSYFTGSSLLKFQFAVDGALTEYFFDDLMRLKRVVDCKGIVTENTYYYAKNHGGGMNDRDYTQTVTDYRSAIDYPNDNSNLETVTDIVYNDGLGRPIQTIKKGQAPDGASDIVLAVEYDAQGRAFKSYEPQQTSSGNNGAFVPIQSGWKYTETKFYASPLQSHL